MAEAHRALQLSPDLRSLKLADMLRELAAGATVHYPGADIRVVAPDASASMPNGPSRWRWRWRSCWRCVRRDAPGVVELAARETADGLVATVAAPGGPLLELADGGLGSMVVRALAKQIGARLEPGPPASLWLEQIVAGRDGS